jgi:hypothetical protein
MPMKQFVLGVVIWFSCLPMLSAHQVRGKVQEANGQPIPYVNVYLENTSKGVLTNVKGEFFLELEVGDYRLVFQRLGYRREVREISVRGPLQLEIILEIEAVEMDAVEIIAGKKDPAYEIMQQVIENKRSYVKQFESYTCETYLKVSLEVDTLFKKRKDLPQAEGTPKARPRLNFIESQSTTYWEFPNRYKSVVHAYRDLAEKQESNGIQIQINGEGEVVGDPYSEATNPYLFYEDVSEADFNFYRNLIDAPDLGDRPFISPLHSVSWRLIYQYRLEDRFLEDGRVVYKIRVQPRNQDGPYFDGHLFIEDESWAIKSVNLEVVPSTLSYFNHFQVIHQYDRTQDGRWTLSKEDYYYNLKDGRVRFYGNTIAVHQNYQLDVQHPKRWFNNETRRIEDEAYEQDSAAWASLRPISLKAAELDFIHIQDSITTHLNSDAYLQEQDSIYNRLTWVDFLLAGIGFRDRKRGMDYYFGPLIEQVRPFGVGGYRHALTGNIAKTWDKYHVLRVQGQIDYGFTNRDLRGYARVDYTYWPKRFGRAYVKGGDVYSLINPNETILGVFSRTNFSNKRYIGVGNHIELFNGLYLETGLELADFLSIDSLKVEEAWREVFEEKVDQPPFDPYRQFVVDVKLRYRPGQKFRTEPNRKVVLGSKWPTFQLHVRQAIPGVGQSNQRFNFTELSADHEFRPGAMGISRWSAKVGTFFDTTDIRFPEYQFFRGSDSYLFANPLRAFQLLGNTVDTTHAYAQVNYLHDFGGALMDKIPLLKRTRLQSTVGAGALWIQDYIKHAEVYAGLQYPFRIKQTRLKIGVYYAVAYSDYEQALNRQVKVGLTFFNAFKNQWEY